MNIICPKKANVLIIFRTYKVYKFFYSVRKTLNTFIIIFRTWVVVKKLFFLILSEIIPQIGKVNDIATYGVADRNPTD